MSCIQLNDFGTTLEFTCIDETSTIQDISSASVKQVIFTKPDGSVLTKAMDFSTDGVDGKVKYVFQDGDINLQGFWKYRFLIESPAGRWTSKKDYFLVE